MSKILVLVMALVSAAAFIVYAYDKMQAKKGAWRVSEKTLLLLAACFGAPGALIAMYSLHHKTLKKKFTLTVPFFLLLQIALIIAI